MINITESQEWVHHERGSSEPAMVRKYQKVAWDMLFKGKTDQQIIHDLNNRFLPANLKLVVFDLANPESCMAQMKELFSYTEYDIHFTIKP